MPTEHSLHCLTTRFIGKFKINNYNPHYCFQQSASSTLPPNTKDTIQRGPTEIRSTSSDPQQRVLIRFSGVLQTPSDQGLLCLSLTERTIFIHNWQSYILPMISVCTVCHILLKNQNNVELHLVESTSHQIYKLSPANGLHQSQSHLESRYRSFSEFSKSNQLLHELVDLITICFIL